MKVTVLAPTEIELKVGDEVEIDIHQKSWTRKVVITKLIETNKGTYAVFDNWTFRSITSYGRTWRKVDG